MAAPFRNKPDHFKVRSRTFLESAIESTAECTAIVQRMSRFHLVFLQFLVHAYMILLEESLLAAVVPSNFSFFVFPRLATDVFAVQDSVERAIVIVGGVHVHKELFQNVVFVFGGKFVFLLNVVRSSGQRCGGARRTAAFVRGSNGNK